VNSHMTVFPARLAVLGCNFDRRVRGFSAASQAMQPVAIAHETRCSALQFSA
jgi:hypothetical protein